MQKSQFPKMRHYVGFWQIGSHMSVVSAGFHVGHHNVNHLTTSHDSINSLHPADPKEMAK